MNLKYYLSVFVLLVLAILFVPFVPSDSMDACRAGDECEDSVGYVSVYTKYLK